MGLRENHVSVEYFHPVQCFVPVDLIRIGDRLPYCILGDFSVLRLYLAIPAVVRENDFASPAVLAPQDFHSAGRASICICEVREPILRSTLGVYSILCILSVTR